MRILTATGVALFVIGGCGMDSPNLLIPSVITVAGMLLTLISLRDAEV